MRGRMSTLPTAFSLICFGILTVPDTLRAQADADVALDSVVVSISEPIHPSSFLAPLNSLHGRTRDGLVRRTVARTLLRPDSTGSWDLDELERNLRRLGIFREIETDRVTARSSSRLELGLRDAWSLYPEPVQREGDDRTALLLRERNVAGTGIGIGVGTDVAERGENPRVFLQLRDPELFESDFRLAASFIGSEVRSDMELLIERPFHTDDDPSVYGLSGSYGDGTDVYFFGDPAKPADNRTDSIDAVRYRASTWFGVADNDEDLFVGSVALHLDRYDPSTPPPIVHAFSNTLGLFAGIASVSRNYRRYERFESTGERFAPTGGMGRVSIGKFLPIAGDSTADDLLYFGAEARQSIGEANWFAHFSVEAGTGLRNKTPERTLLRAGASTGIRTGPGLLAARSELQVVWRWPRYIYSSAQGVNRILRGYDETDVIGDNHVSGILEYRIDPVVRVLSIGISPTLFWDVAGFWNRDREFSSTRFHHSAGAGIRLWYGSGVSRPGFRLDVAWDFDRDRIGGLSIGIEESFDLFGFLGYVPPGPYLPE